MSAKDQDKPTAEAPESTPDAAAAIEPAPPEDDLTVARREVAELKDKNLRLQAELQNAQKRMQRDKEEALRFAEADFARELLVVLDDLERTLQVGDAPPAIQGVLDGVRITKEHFLKLLQQRGIKPIEATGKLFDPTYHEAILQQPSTEHPAGTVIQEVARGYTMHERVLRPARVIVASGPAAEAGNEAAK